MRKLRKHKRKNRILAVSMVLLLFASTVPLSGFAASDDNETKTTAVSMEQSADSQEETANGIMMEEADAETVSEPDEEVEASQAMEEVSEDETSSDDSVTTGQETLSEDEASYEDGTSDEGEYLSELLPDGEMDIVEEGEADEEDAGIAELAWTGTTSGKVVLNLGNGNGKYNFADYAGNKDAGTDLRYTTDSLAEYASDDGTLQINLPADNNLGSTFTVVDAAGSLSAVTVALEKEQAYDYKLVGWVNIATGEYYDVSGGATTADIDLDNENVFYADWIAATYDHGSSSDENLRDDTVSTAGFVTMHMYDYNELYNLYSESLVQNGTTSEAWTDSGNLYNSLPYGTGNRLTSSFIFVNDGTTSKPASTTGGMLSWPIDKTDGNTYTGIGVAPRDATEIWGITSPDSAPMNMLFDPESSALGVHYVGDADYLFWVDKDGYYTYNSKESAATYNQTDQRFYVYDDTQAVTGTGFSCFLPYNTYGSALSAYDGSVNYWFGMDMEVNFYLPNDTGTEGGNQSNGNDMVFNFSGDDDILIFIDDELVLDMSGIHDESFGSINFSDGTVKMAMTEEELDDDTTTPLRDGNTTTLSLSRGSHDLKVYYMERGGYASNLEIQFNVASLWEYENGDVQTITAEKTWIDAQGNVIDPANLPDAYKNTGVEVGLFDVLGAATEDTNGYTQDGDVYTVKFTDDSGVTRTYVYDNSGETPTLNYTEISSDGSTTASGMDDQVDSEGRVLDNDGYVVAWLEDGSLHIRMDKQTLSDANGWYYAWELLDPDGSYEVLELTSSSSYTTTNERENLTTYNYWSIIGDKEIENSIETGGTLPVILTEAAQEASNTLGDTKDAMGWVIVASESGITTEQVEFSQIAELLEFEDESTGQTSYETIAGVTSQSEINRLGSGAIWYVEDAETQTGDITGNALEDFHLYCILNGTRYYLVLDENTLDVTTDASAAGTFCYDSLGELLVVLDDGSIERVEIQPDGTITIGEAELGAAKDDIRIFTLQETATSGFAFTAVNKFLPDITLKKIDSETEAPLSGAEFTLQNADGLYYSYDENTDEVTWVSKPDDDESWNAPTVITGEDGTVIIHYLEDGTYTLKEVSAPDDYVSIKDVITITVATEDGKTTVEVGGSDSASADEDELIVTIKNDMVNPQITKEIAEDDYERKEDSGEEMHDGEDTSGEGWGTWDDADNNQEVTYHLKVTDLENVKNLTVHDYLEDGLDFEPDTVAVSKYDDGTETVFMKDTDYTVSQGTCSDPECQMKGCTFEVKFADNVLEDISSDAYIMITYNALTDTHEKDYEDYEDEILNYSYLTYGVSTLSRSGIVTTATDLFGFGVYKYTDEFGEEVALSGAEFILERGGMYATFTVEYDSETGDRSYMVSGWKDTESIAGILTSDADGMIRIEGLDDDTYSLTETKAPAGYEIVDETITVVINEDGNVTVNDDIGTKEAVIGHVVNVENDLILTSVEGTKTWVDNNDQDGYRPESITIRLWGDGSIVDTQTITPDDDGNWSWSFTDLPKFNNGVEIIYNVTEDIVPDYSTTYSEDSYDVTNTHTPAQTSLTVLKVWDDSNDQDGKRPDDITVELLADGKETGKTLTLDESNSWRGSFTDLDKYEDGGTEIEYTVEELEIEDYTSVIRGNATIGYEIENTHTTETIDLSGIKTWDDDDDALGYRPDVITIRLFADDMEIDHINITEKENWEWSFTGLDKYENGEEIVYTIKEDPVENYVTDISIDEDGNYVITNTLIDPQISKEIAEDDYERKEDSGEEMHVGEDTSGDGWGTWDDADNMQELTYHLTLTDLLGVTNLTVHDYLEDGLDFEPDTIEIELYDGDVEKALVADTDYTMTVGACSDPECAMDGCTFEVKFEDSVFEDISSDAYIVVIYKALTDTHEEDYDNYDDEILNHSYMSYGSTVTRRSDIVTTATDLFGFGVYKYADEFGVEVALSGAQFVLEREDESVYAVFDTETDVETGETYYMLNSWVDDMDTATILTSGEDGMIRIEGLDDDSYTLIETKAPVGYEIVDEEITVMIDEDGNVTVEGDTGSMEAVVGHEVYVENTLLLTEVEGTKTWNDNDNQDGMRPDSIIIRLLANGVEVDSKVVTEADNWSYSFTDLRMYQDGVEIAYTIIEDAMDDYSAEYDGYDVNNTHTPGQTSVSVTKVWDDAGDQDGIRPDNVDVQLFADGEAVEDAVLTLNEENNWTGSFTELDIYRDQGDRIEYTVEEVDVPENYECTISEIAESSYAYAVTNAYTPETTGISGVKTWDDDDDSDGMRPESITIRVLADGVAVDSATVTAADNWSWDIDGLDKYRDGGVEIVYSITEDAVENYTASIEGYDVTNTYVPDETTPDATGANGSGTNGTGANGTSGGNSKTGDTANTAAMWIILLAACALMLGVGSRMRRRA